MIFLIFLTFAIWTIIGYKFGHQKGHKAGYNQAMEDFKLQINSFGN